MCVWCIYYTHEWKCFFFHRNSHSAVVCALRLYVLHATNYHTSSNMYFYPYIWKKNTVFLYGRISIPPFSICHKRNKLPLHVPFNHYCGSRCHMLIILWIVSIVSLFSWFFFFSLCFIPSFSLSFCFLPLPLLLLLLFMFYIFFCYTSNDLNDGIVLWKRALIMCGLPFKLLTFHFVAPVKHRLKHRRIASHTIANRFFSSYIDAFFIEQDSKENE